VTRLETLLQFYKDDPTDPFNVYGLALEYLKTDLAKSREFFMILLEKHPDYLPAYYHAAKLFADLNEGTKAIETFEKGITLAKKQGDLKAARELQSALDEFVF
jgi:hypothetical protein